MDDATDDDKLSFTTRVDTPKGPQKLAYRQQKGRHTGVVFCGGFRSDLTGTKATALADWARARDHPYLRFDYFGHGASDGDFTDGTMSHWRGDIPHMLDTLTDGPQVLVGSSFGGWLSLMAALDRPEKVAGLVLIAPAVDMTERLMWDRFSDKARAKLEKEGLIYDPSEYDPEGYPITRALIEDGRQHLLLTKAIALDIPVRILHGQQDDAVPWELSLELASALTSQNVTLQFLKDGDHRLSTPAQIDTLCQLIDDVLTAIARP
jgi:pimeloyl-ACP methyl ester carboxylesterase